ncbi:ABC transporter ATP-binding protein [Prauserella marina]|uniref:D-methionine transport system ATP-binding protein n=1 Tax=Prauserella marina TaxID=530584 RepID=A0A222W0G5_9PSEU|nr:ATP-binding cassette domain-containing protein [Prauserella marina]ASR39698.1 ABC transporter ATP-binding protein [Prauserella marina]PWV73301.1 D-methionine transport system ATP-binding protein [Prauserella marina]SDD66889.1 D-methionine transport system ATP-binding protein [Prauserella marina]
MITVENISKSFASTGAPVVALRDVSLAVGAGSLYGVVGSASAGKSTLARCVALQERPDRGVVRYDGLNTTALEGRRLRDARRQLAVVDSRLQPERTVAGNVAAPLERTGVEGPQRRNKVGSLLDLVGLSKRAAQLPAELTEGQRRRVAIARALAVQPSVLLADDPTHGVEPDDAGSVLTVLDRARAELGATVLLTTQDAGTARRICDEVALLERGVVVESGNVLGLLGKPGSKIADELLPSVETSRSEMGRYDRTVDTVLIGFAAVGALLPEAAGRFDVELATIGGGLTRFGDTPVARFRLGVRGQRADAALAWIAEHGASVSHPLYGLHNVAA